MALGKTPHPERMGIYRFQDWIGVVRPSTARFARAQDEVIPSMPSPTYLILSRQVEAAARVEGRSSFMQRIVSHALSSGRSPSLEGRKARCTVLIMPPSALRRRA